MTLAIAVNHPRFFLTNRLTLAKGVKAKGYHVVVLCPEDKECDEIRKLGFAVEPIYMQRKSISPFAEMRSLFSFWQALRKVKPEIFHGFTVKCVLYGILASRLARVPTIVGTVTGLGTVFLMQNILGSFLRGLVGMLYRVICRGNVNIIFQNSDDREHFLGRGWVKENNAHLILGTGIDLDAFYPSEILPVKNEARILFPSRLLKDKGVRELLQACEELYHEGVPLKLQICGWLDQDSRSGLSAEELARVCKLPFIEWMGQRADMPQVMANCHIVCLPSYREGIPVVLMEACASGRPIVTTDVPGCREVVQHGLNGLLVPAKSASGLKDALKTLIQSPSVQKEMASNGRKIAEKMFSAPMILEQNLNVYGRAA